MKAIRRFLSPSDVPEGRAPRRSLSMRFRSPSTKSRPLSQHSSTSAASSQISSRISSLSHAPSTRGFRRRGGGAIIDAEDYPRVIMTIMQNAPRSALLKLRQVSHSFRDMADAQLARHLVLTAPVGVSSLRVTSRAESPSQPETGIPGLSVRVLWNREERRRLTRILTGTQVVDLRGPSRARDCEIADLTLQCSCARTVRMLPDAAGNPPTACPLPPQVTQLVAFTSLAADSSPAEKNSRRQSWLVTDREHLHMQAATTAYVGPVPNLIQSLVVTVRYPRSPELISIAARSVPPRPLRPLAPWDHPQSLHTVTVVFLPEEPKPVKPRPRSFLGVAPTESGDSPTPIFRQRSIYRESSSGGSRGNKRFSWLTSSPVDPNFPTPLSPSSPVDSFAPVDPSFPATPVPTLRPLAPAILFSDADAGTGNIAYLTLFIRSVAAHLHRVSYELVDVSRIDSAILGLPPGTLLSPRQVERLIIKALRSEMLHTGWESDDIDGLMANLRFTTKQEYAKRVGEGEFHLHTVE